MIVQTLARNRCTYALLIAFTIFIGLASRRFAHSLPWWLAKNAGDILYATMAFWLVGFLLPTLSTLRAAIVAAAFCFVIEFSKLLQTPWLTVLRHSMAGALVLGVGFHASNLACYLLGVLLGAGIEFLLTRTRA